jgi:hypothetical protein
MVAVIDLEFQHGADTREAVKHCGNDWTRGLGKENARKITYQKNQK